jgi:hypothetical protein
MPQRRVRAAAAAFLLVAGLAGRSDAQTAPQGTAPAARPPVLADVDARETRQRLDELLKRQPPAVGRVLKLDPSLIANQGYLAPYPALRAFLADHPEIAQNASYYFANVPGYNQDWETEEGRRQQVRLNALENMMGGLAALAVFGVVTAVLTWLVRTALNHRRWNRLSKIQAEVHTKLMDRFSSNDELLAYVQTPSGRRFLESGPSPTSEEPRVGAPFSRILWSVQAGVVLAAGGLGVLLARGSFTEYPELDQFLLLLGALVLALGVGFMVSAGAAYLLSRRLGLLERPAPDHA